MLGGRACPPLLYASSSSRMGNPMILASSANTPTEGPIAKPEKAPFERLSGRPEPGLVWASFALGIFVAAWIVATVAYPHLRPSDLAPSISVGIAVVAAVVSLFGAVSLF